MTDSFAIQHAVARKDALLEKEEGISILPIAPIDGPCAPPFDPFDGHRRSRQRLLSNEACTDIAKELGFRCPFCERSVRFANAALYCICHTGFLRSPF